MHGFLIAMLRVEAQRAQAGSIRAFDRALPFGEMIVDRWTKARMLGMENGASVYDSSIVIGDVEVGEDTWVGPFVILDGSGGLKIGANCSISAGVHIYTHDTVGWALTRGTKEIEREPVMIGDCCYIGPNVVISKGLTIGDRCVIGANSFVNSNLPNGSRAWGIPARVQP